MAETMTSEARAAGLPGPRGKDALITGGSSGVGQANAVRFAEYGANDDSRAAEEARDTEERVHARTANIEQIGVRDVLPGAAVWRSAAASVPALDVAPPCVFWGRQGVAIDLLHHAVHAVATALANPVVAAGRRTGSER